jgi:hypothetical protein
MNIVNRLRSPLIALIVLALSATAVFAAKTISDTANTSNVGLAQATVASSHVPQAGAAEAPDKSSEGKDSTTGTDATTGTKPPDNHGATVSGAASLSFDALKTACGGNLKNKGAYMSLIARGLYVFKSSSGKITCGPAPKTSGTTSLSSSVGTTPPTKLHGKANADAKRTAHQPQPPR